MNIKLKACPFCGCDMRVESNRDWHRLFGDHKEDCLFDSDECQFMMPATDSGLKYMIECWNNRVE